MDSKVTKPATCVSVGDVIETPWGPDIVLEQKRPARNMTDHPYDLKDDPVHLIMPNDKVLQLVFTTRVTWLGKDLERLAFEKKKIEDAKPKPVPPTAYEMRTIKARKRLKDRLKHRRYRKEGRI